MIAELPSHAHRPSSCSPGCMQAVSGDVPLPPGVTRCAACHGDGAIVVYHDEWHMNHSVPCFECDGVGFFGIDPESTCPDLPGSQLKLAYLCQRYRAGKPLWRAGE